MPPGRLVRQRAFRTSNIFVILDFGLGARGLLELATFRYAQGAWSQSFPQLDSANTMVLAFASPDVSGADRADRHAQTGVPEQRHHRVLDVGRDRSGADPRRVDHGRGRALRAHARRRRRPGSTRPGTRSTRARIANELAAPDLRAVFVLSDGLTSTAASWCAGSTRACPDVVVTGGLAGDGDRFGRRG